MTIKQAKELAIERNGRLPRCGWETVVEEGCRQGEVIDLNDRTVYGWFEYRVYLSNEGGRFRVWEWHNPFPVRFGW